MFEQRTVHGAYFALTAFIFWGVVPIYFKLVSHVSPIEILMQRALWSVVLLLGILAYTKQLSELMIPVRKIGVLLVSSILLAINWLIFIYAIVNGNIVETSLGYFINPLVSVFLGMLFLGERPRPLQWLAIIITAGGIGFQLVYYGAVPWLALGLAFSFGFYGLIRKNLNLHAIAGLTVETLIISPFAMLGLFWVYQQGELKFGSVDFSTDLLLILSAFITSFPLLCYAAAVKRLSLTATGMFQYIAPSLSLIIAILVYNESFGIDRIITFTCIWVALAIFTCETMYHHRRRINH